MNRLVYFLGALIFFSCSNDLDLVEEKKDIPAAEPVWREHYFTKEHRPSARELNKNLVEYLQQRSPRLMAALTWVGRKAKESIRSATMHTVEFVRSRASSVPQPEEVVNSEDIEVVNSPASLEENPDTNVSL